MYKASYNGLDIKLNQYKPEMQGHLFCKSCGVPVTHTGEHIRQLGDREICVSAYFRLKNKTKFPHTEKCDYVVENRVKYIYACCCDDSEIMTKQDEKYIVRLHIITDSMEIQSIDTNEFKAKMKRNKSTLQYIRSGDKPAYISTIRKIMRLRNEVENESDLAEKLYLNFYNLRTSKYDDIQWKNFFVEHDKDYYKRMYNYLLKRVYHPICFCATVKKIQEPTDKFPWYKFKCYSIKTDENQYVSFEILFKNRDIYEEYKNNIEGKEIVVYGSDHYATEPRKDNDKKEIEYLNMNTRIYGKNQIMILD